MKHMFRGLVVPAIVTAGLVTAAMSTAAEAQTRELRFAEFGPNAGARAGAHRRLRNEPSHGRARYSC